MARRQVSVYINSQEVAGSIKAIAKEKRALVAELNRMVVGSQEYEDQIRKIKGLDVVLNEHSSKLRGVQKGYGALVDGVKGFISGAAAGFAGVFAVDQIVRYGGELFNLGSQMELLQQKARTIFAETLPSVTAAAENNATAMGLTTQQYINQAAAIADLLVPMGFQRTEAADISTELVNLSGALSEWTGGQKNAQEVTEILGDAILGERESLKGLGIDIQQAEIDARLAKQGLGELTGEFRQQAEAATTLQLILEKSTDAQAAYAKNSDTLVRRQAELRARTQEVVESLAVALLPIFERLVDVAATVATGIEKAGKSIIALIDPAKAARSEFEAQQVSVANLESELVPLLNRYDELKGKSKLTKDEQAELSKIIQRVGEITPGAVTEIDDYGRALSINAGASREFLEAERARLQFTQREAIASTKEEIEGLKEKQALLKQEIETQRGITAASAPFKTDLGDKELIARRQELANVTTLLTGAEQELRRLRGDQQPGAPTTPTTTTTTGDDVDRDAILRQQAAAEERRKEQERQQEQEQKDLERHLEQLQQITDKFNNDAKLAQLTDNERELELVRQKYDTQIALAKELESKGIQDATAQRIELEQLKAQELAALEDEQNQAELTRLVEHQLALAEQELLFEEQRKEIQDALKIEADEILLTERELAIQQLEEHYAQLIATANAYGIETGRLEDAFQKNKLGIQKKYADQEKKEIFDKQQERLRGLASAYGSFASTLGQINDLLIDQGIQNTAIQKILSLAQIGFKTAEAIANATASASSIPYPGNIAAIASAVATVIANIASAVRILKGTSVPQRYTGGFFDVTGQDDGRQYNAKYIGSPGSGMLPGRPVLLASERGPEYFVANQDLRNPLVMDHVRAIENIKGRGVPQYQEGGATAPLPEVGTDPRLMELISQNIAINDLLLQRLDRIEARIDDDTIIEMQRRLNVLNRAAGQ